MPARLAIAALSLSILAGAAPGQDSARVSALVSGEPPALTPLVPAPIPTAEELANALRAGGKLARVGGWDPGLEPFRGRTRAGAVTSQGDFGPLVAPGSVNAAAARQAFGVDGTGIRIGIVSDSFNSDGLLGQAVASGDIPPNVTILRDDLDLFSLDEGRAMAEIIHDIAPGAELVFHSAFNNPATFVFEESLQFAFNALANAGVDIIVDDVFSFDSPFFQDGLAADAAQNAFEQGIPFFSAAGNDGNESWEGPFREFFDGFNFVHDFDLPSAFQDSRLRIDVPPGGVTVVVQWDNPYRVLGAPPSFPYTDLDVRLLNAGEPNPNNFIDGSFADQTGLFGPAAEPFEIVGVSNNSPFSQQVELYIDIFTGPATDIELKVIVFGGFINDSSDTDSRTVFGQPAATGVFALGAAPFFDDDAEPFSSFGPARITRTQLGFVTNDVRAKPDALATDDVNTTFFGFDSPFDPDGFPNFSGTSAAAPHAAAVAALALELARGQGEDPTPTELYDLMRQTARTPGPFSLDPNLSGAGLIDAENLLAEIGGPQGCSPADLVIPFGVISQADVAEFVALFFANDPFVAGLAVPFDVVSQLDVAEFIDLFFAGCPAN